MASAEAARIDSRADNSPHDAAVHELSVMIAVLTYRRTETLQDTIHALLRACKDHPSATLLIVDNNPSDDARTVVEGIACHEPLGRLRYAHERRPGIAAARNRAMNEAGDAELLVFVDDDERPQSGWLENLTRLQRERTPAAITGPVIPEFERRPEPWIIAGQSFVRRSLPTGTNIQCAATNNLLLDMAQIRALGLRFDERFGLTGGEDTLFTRQLTQRGGVILWCAEAVMIDRIPESRLSRRWVLRRALSMGNSRARVDIALARTGATRAVARLYCGFGGMGRVAVGVAQLGFGTATRTLSHRARGARLVAKGVGMILGAFGFAHHHYARTKARIVDCDRTSTGSRHG